ncbi:MAG: CotH kinase family protein [Bacteroidota bacterium]
MRFLCLFLIGCLHTSISAQALLNPALGSLFADEQIPRIDILMDADSLDILLAPGNEFNNHEYPATFIFDDGTTRDTMFDIGFRLRGNTSRTAPKKSFKVSFNTFESGRKYQGVEKLNLNGEHNDPSIARSKICWDLARSLNLPASRANHVALYINNDYRGLYINVEHIDDEFVQRRYGNTIGNLYKCLWPATLEYVSDNPEAYKFTNNGRRAYDLKTNEALDDYSDLAHFIDVLNNTPLAEIECAIEAIFNVNSYLKAAAFDIIIANWDGHIFNKNNFYLYHDPSTGQFEYIPYDLDNTLGIDWFGVDWAERDLYEWAPSGEPRPIYQRLLEVPTYRSRFTYFVEKIANQLLDPNILAAQVETLKNNMVPFIENDPFYPLSYGFNLNHFNNSFTEALSYFHTPTGILPYFNTRKNTALTQAENTNSSPIVFALRNNFPDLGQNIEIKAEVEDDDAFSAEVFYSTDEVNWSSTPLLDDGQQADGEAGDGTYGALLPGMDSPGTLFYYVVVEDQTGQQSISPSCGNRSITFEASLAIGLVINEFMASNNNSFADEFGEYDDWIEIFNADNQDIDLNGKSLSDDPSDRSKWALPNITMSPGQYLIFWADGDPDQGDFHTNFKLKASGEHIGLYADEASGFGIIDTLSYGQQSSDVSQGRLPNGSGPIQTLSIASPGANNDIANSTTTLPTGIQHRVQPNPFAEATLLHFEWNQSASACVRIYNTLGQQVEQRCSQGAVHDFQWQWRGRNANQQPLPDGLYYAQLLLDEQVALQIPIVLQR